MAITFANVEAWLKKTTVKGFRLSSYPTVGKAYTIKLENTVVGNHGKESKASTLVSEVVKPLPGGQKGPGPGGANGQSLPPTFTKEALAKVAKELIIKPYDGPS
jgi:hypothetical protein